MAIKGMRFASLEWKNITSSKVMWVVIAALAVIPLLYGALYLAAFEDPYRQLNTVPVAVVNLDEGAVIAGEDRNVGEDVVDALQETDEGMEWNFVSETQAEQGLADGSYYMVCTIPRDFSEHIASADSAAPQKAQMLIEYNPSENMLASQVGETVWATVRTQMNDTVVHEYWTTVFNRIADSGQSIRIAADGAGSLSNGLSTAKEGSELITANLGSLGTGLNTLDSGLSDLSSGASSLNTGLTALQSGAQSANAGAQQLAAGSDQLKAGSSQLTGGLQQLEGNSSTLTEGSAAVMGGLGQLAEGSSTFEETVAANISFIQQQVGNDPKSTADAAAFAYQSALANCAQILGEDDVDPVAAQAALASLNDAATTMASTQHAAGAYSSLTTVQSGYSQIGGGIAALNQQYVSLNQGITDYTAAVSQLSSGAATLDNGVAQAQAGTKALASGTNQLSAGTGTAQNGAGKIAAGATSAQAGAAQAASGASQLEAGSASLTDGLTAAFDGSDELSAKLGEGADEAESQTTGIEAKADVMAAPIELDSEYYSTVKNYGTGFAPYFMALAIWVGCLVSGFVFKPLNNRLILSGSNPFMVAFANYLPMAFFALIQATLLMLVMQFGLQLQIDNVPAFYAMGYLVALVFSALMQMLAAAFGFPGKFVAIILLMLQLTASAGTFPIETTPAFFQVINPWMPMTYVVEGMRQIMTGSDYSQVAFDAAVLAALGIGCFCVTAWVAYRKRMVRMEDLHPILQLG